MQASPAAASSVGQRKPAAKCGGTACPRTKPGPAAAAAGPGAKPPDLSTTAGAENQQPGPLVKQTIRWQHFKRAMCDELSSTQLRYAHTASAVATSDQMRACLDGQQTFQAAGGSDQALQRKVRKVQLL
jgi:hypothetical protein